MKTSSVFMLSVFLFSAAPLTAFAACENPAGLSATVFSMIEAKQSERAVQAIEAGAKTLHADDRNAACETYFHVAIRTAQAKVLNQLVASGLDVRDLQSTDPKLGVNLLTYVFQKGSLSTIRKYLERGQAIPDQRIVGVDRTLMTALVYYSNFDAIGALIAEDPSVSKEFVTTLQKVRLGQMPDGYYSYRTKPVFDETALYTTLKSPAAPRTLKLVVGELKSTDIDPKDYPLIAMMRLLERGASANAAHVTYLARSSIEPKTRAANLAKLKEVLEADKPDVKTVATILASGISADETIDYGGAKWNLLNLAIDQGDAATVKAVLAAGADPNATTLLADGTRSDWNSLDKAAHQKNPELLRILLATNVDRSKAALSRALLNAATTGRIENAKLLRKIGADVNLVGPKSWSPLEAAAYYGQVEMIDWLLGAGADVNFVDVSGLDALMFGTLSVKSTVIVPRLLSAGASASRASKSGFTALFGAIVSREPDTWKAILAKKPDVNVTFDEELKVYAKNAKGSGADLNRARTIPKKSTPLAVAVHLGLRDASRALLDAGAAVDPVDANGSTPLKIAFLSNDVEIQKMLLAKNPSLDILDSEGTAYLNAVVAAEDQNLLRAVLATHPDLDKPRAVRPSSPPMTPLMTAVRFRLPRMVAELLRAGAKTEVRDTHGNTPLIMAANLPDGSAAEIVKLLIDAKANPSAVNPESGHTPVTAALLGNNRDALGILLAHGANANGASPKNVPLIMAADFGDVEAVRTLVKAGADVNAPDAKGKTALIVSVADAEFDYGENRDADESTDYSWEEGQIYDLRTRASSDETLQAHLAIARALLAARADRRIRDNAGHTAFHYASFKIWGPSIFTLK